MGTRLRRDGHKKSRTWALLFVFVSVFCIIFFAAQGRFQAPVLAKSVSTVAAPFEKAISWVGSQLRYVTSNIWEIATVHEQNKMLRNEVDQLRIQNLQASEYAAENARLRALLGYKQAAMQFDLVAARVIGREADSWSHMIVIDRGTADGVKENMAVVTEKGLVGHVIEAGPNYAKVQLILDPRSSVGTLVQRAESRVVGIVEGDPANPMMPRMINVPKNADIEEGDIIVTSGFGGMYPKGLVVGLVSSLENDEAGLLKIALLEPAVDFQKLEDVAVIVNSREAPPEPLKTPVQTPGTETDPAAEKKAQEAQAVDGENTTQEQDMQAQAGESD